MQIFIFLTCACCGILSGVVYDVLYIARCAVCGIHKQAYTVKDRIFTAACDILYCLVYMFIGCVVGALLYLKSFHIFVAFSVKKVYNKITSKKK